MLRITNHGGGTIPVLNAKGLPASRVEPRQILPAARDYCGYIVAVAAGQMVRGVDPDGLPFSMGVNSFWHKVDQAEHLASHRAKQAAPMPQPAKRPDLFAAEVRRVRRAERAFRRA